MRRTAWPRCLWLLFISTPGVNAFAQTQAASQPTTITGDELASKVLRAYRAARYLKFNLDVTSGSHRLRAQVEMAPQRLLTHVSKNGETFAVAGLTAGVCWEFRPRWKDSVERELRNVYVEYESRTPSGSGSMILAEHEDCLYGTLLQTWVGQSGLVERSFAERIRATEKIEAATVDEAACWAVTTRDEQHNGYFEQRYCFDRETFLLRRWETHDVQEGTLTLRVREYSNIEVRESAPDSAFAEEKRFRSVAERQSAFPTSQPRIRIGELPRFKK